MVLNENEILLAMEGGVDGTGPTALVTGIIPWVGRPVTRAPTARTERAVGAWS